MESQNVEFNAIKEIHRRMADGYGDSSPKYSTMANWSAEFKRGRDSLDDPGPGRPVDVISQNWKTCARRIKVADTSFRMWYL